MTFEYVDPLNLTSLRDERKPARPKVGAQEDGSFPWVPALSTIGAGVGAYHGYLRNNSVGWGVVWGLLGAAFPIFVVPIAFAQGIGKRA